MVPAGIAFPHYENFRCGYNVTSEIVPSHRVAGHQRAHQVIAGWCCSESTQGVELRLVATILALPSLFGRVRLSMNQTLTVLFIFLKGGWLWLNDSEQVVSADGAVYNCKLSPLIVCESVWPFGSVGFVPHINSHRGREILYSLGQHINFYM